MDNSTTQPPAGFITLPSQLPGFVQESVRDRLTASGRVCHEVRGTVAEWCVPRRCACGAALHVNARKTVTLRHLPMGPDLVAVVVERPQVRCPECGATAMAEMPFKAEGHMATAPLLAYARSLLASGSYTLREVGSICGLGKNVVKDIDLARLRELHTVDGERLKAPERQARYLGVDEFKLHDGHRYATHVMDLETGEVLWIAHTKKKQVVYDFVEHVGLEWMAGVVAVACDMNSDFCEAFLERCPHLSIVFDHFHIVKNFNEKVVAEVRKDEQRRLKAEGDEAGAKALKGSKYVLCSSRSTLARKDEEAEAGKVLSKGSALFGTEDVARRGGHLSRYEQLIASNELLFACDLVKEQLAAAYRMDDAAEMAVAMEEVLAVCDGTGDRHFAWFAKLLRDHAGGILSHAEHRISSGKVEGVNNRIKTIRRQGYGYPDDEYFFLKIIDSSRTRYVENPKSHKFCD